MRIEVRHASKSFGDITVLDEFSCEIKSGCVTALVGPSGSGKSTLLALLAGFQRLDSGQIMYRDLTGKARPPDPQLVAWVPQGSNALGARSALDNVMISALASGMTLESAAEVASNQLERVGLSELSGVAARRLSGGELQRVGFARALAARKPLVFADEPTSSLDAANTDQVAKLILSLRRSATIVVATHDPTLVESAEEVVEVRRRDVHRA